MRKITNEELGRPSAEEFARMEKMPVAVVLDNVRSMQNVGAFFRTADAFASLLKGCADFFPEEKERRAAQSGDPQDGARSRADRCVGLFRRDD